MKNQNYFLIFSILILFFSLFISATAQVTDMSSSVKSQYTPVATWINSLRLKFDGSLITVRGVLRGGLLGFEGSTGWDVVLDQPVTFSQKYIVNSIQVIPKNLTIDQSGKYYLITGKLVWNRKTLGRLNLIPEKLQEIKATPEKIKSIIRHDQ